MKQYKKPTRDQKELLDESGFNPKEWRFVEKDGECDEFINPETKEHIFLERRL
jgi:hypothetical protein